MKTKVIFNDVEEEREVDYIVRNSNPAEPDEIVPVLREGECMTWILTGSGKQALVFNKKETIHGKI
jgi:hypothetical protein